MATKRTSKKKRGSKRASRSPLPRTSSPPRFTKGQLRLIRLDDRMGNATYGMAEAITEARDLAKEIHEEAVQVFNALSPEEQSRMLGIMGSMEQTFQSLKSLHERWGGNYR